MPTATHATAAAKLLSEVRLMAGFSFRTFAGCSARAAAAATGRLQRRNPADLPLMGGTKSRACLAPDHEYGDKRRGDAGLRRRASDSPRRARRAPGAATFRKGSPPLITN